MYLGGDLKKATSREKFQISKSSIYPQEMDIRGLKDLLEEKDRLIRKLQKRVKTLEKQLNREPGDKKLTNLTDEDLKNDNQYMQLLKSEIGKTKRLKQIIEDITERVHQILQQLSHDNTITQNSEDIKEMIMMLEASKNQSFSSDSYERQLEISLNISNEWARAMDILQGAFKTYKMKFQAFNMQQNTLTSDYERTKKKILELQTKISENEETRLMLIELKQQKKQKQKMKKLLEKSEFQKNELINKINSTMIKQDVKGKTKEQLLQYSKELNYRIKDLQIEKASIIKETNKEKQDQLKKYQDFLKRLKGIKEKSIIGKSYG